MRILIDFWLFYDVLAIKTLFTAKRREGVDGRGVYGEDRPEGGRESGRIEMSE